MRTRRAGKILLYCFAGLVGLLLVLMLALKLALDRAPAYQAEIKQWVHAQTGYHIAFAGVSPSFRWYGPELHFERLELRSKDDRRILARAAGGRVAADIWQLISSGKLLAGRIELDSPSIAITRLGPASFALASEIKLGGKDSSLETLTLDDLPAGKLAIRHAVVTMQNWNSALPQLALRDVSLDVQRGEKGLSVAFNARLPPVLGGILGISANAHGLERLQSLDWTASASARDISFPGWRLLLPEFLSRLDAGSGAFNLAASGTGPMLTRADLDFAAHGVVTQLKEGPNAKFEQISGAMSVNHAGDRWSLSGRRLRAVRSGRQDPESQFDASWRGGDAGLLELHARASYLRADALLPLSGLLPDKGVRNRLREIAPTGEWMDTVVALERASAAEPWRLQVQATFRDVGFAPVGRSPGLRGLSGTIAGTESGGHVNIDTHSAVFSWPAQFSQPVDLETLKTTLYWKRTNDELLIATPDWAMKNRDAAVHGQAAWAVPAADGSSPVLTLAVTVENGNASAARNYLPRERISPPALAWLDRAFVAGRLSRANVVLQGPIRHFPFRDGSGLFLARCALDGLTLDYSEGWPRAENVAARAEFRNEGLTAHFLSGRVGDFPVESADARFADFKTGELEIHVAAGGDAGDALKFLRASPLDASAEHAFSDVEARGPMQSKVDLYLPFKDFVHRRVLVHGHLDGVMLGRRGSTLTAADLNGDFDVDGAQVAAADVRGRLLGGTFQMQARAPRSRPLSRTQLEFRGTFSADAVRAALALPAGIAIDGQIDWRAVLKMAPEPNRERSLRISSSLVGLETKLPAPLDKAADAPLPSWLEIQWPASGGALGRLALGSVLSGSYALESNANGTRLAHLALSFGAGESSADRRDQIFNVGGSVGRLDLAGWLSLNLGDKNAKPLSDYLRSAELNVAELDYLGLAFRDVSLDLAVAEGGLRITVGGPNVAGTIALPSARDSSDPWNLQFERLHFDVASGPEGQEGGGATGDDHAPPDPARTGLGNPRAIPALHFHAADVSWGERQYGDVQATLVKLEDGVGLKQLTVTGGNFNVSATGEWRGKDMGSGRVEGALTSNDVQATLKQLGYVPVIESKSGRMDFDLKWVGAPTGDALSQAAGHVQLTLDKGQIVGLNPGAGRVLGLTSVAALRRRLALDFSDLTDKGLAFDTVRGDFDLREGSAYTDNLLVKGPAAEIGLIGRVGLKNKDYDQTAVVTGSVGNSLPLAALAGGPVVGAAVLLFTQVFKQPLKGLARGYYRITGSWDNPIVERIKSADAAASAEAPK
jgi:uncharacterized protein (TIGR02099 family)